MKPTLDRMRYRKALNALVEQTDANIGELDEALTNEAQIYRQEEPDSELLLEDIL